MECSQNKHEKNTAEMMLGASGGANNACSCSFPGGAHGRIYGPCIVCIVFTHGFQRKSKNSLKTNSETVGMAEFCGALLGHF
jgi:hypothetical protein